MMKKILIADDDNLSREFLAEFLRGAGHEVHEADTGNCAVSLFEDGGYDLVFSDMRMPDGDGLVVLDGVKRHNPQVPVILVTAYGSVETAVQAMQDGAEDFIMKPVTMEQIDLVMDRLENREQLQRENKALKACIAEETGYTGSIGEHQKWQHAVSLAERVAKTKATVLIRGESGSGKEVLASHIHQMSARRRSPFIKTNCAVLQDTLLTSELFGHEKGAFTGAHTRKEGRFELASGGTLFLDEIGEISPEIQAKLLRVIETGEFERVGGKETLKVDVRILCATNRNLEEMMEQGMFREDLFYRLNVVPVIVPALRDRSSDIELLAYHFLERYSKEYGGIAKGFSPSAMRAMNNYSWPGNVRELANVVQRTVLLCTDDLIDEVQLGLPRATTPAVPSDIIGQTIAEMERRLILGTLKLTQGNKTEASRVLGVTARTLSNKIKTYREKGTLPPNALI